MNKEKNELTTTKTNAIANASDDALGAAGQVSASDLMIGRIGCLQHLSQLVKDGVAKSGTIVDTETGEVLGGAQNALSFLILSVNKYWIITENDEYKARIPGTHQNEYPWEEGNIKRMFNISYYVLLKKDLDKEIIMPYEISFRSTELRTARKIQKILFVLGSKGQPSWCKYFNAKVVERKKGKYSWFAYDISVGEDVKAEYQEAAAGVFKQIARKEPAAHTEQLQEEYCPQHEDTGDVPF